MSISEVFAALGEGAFRDGEHRVLARLLAGRPSIIATGGGGFVDARNRSEIRRWAVSVFINADVDVLWQRVRSRSGRPLLEVPDPRATLAELHKRRYPIYAEADVTVHSRRDSSSFTVAHDVLAAVRVFGRDHPDRQVLLESA